MDIFGAFIAWIAQLMVPYMEMPASTVFTFVLSVSLSVISSASMRLGTDVKKYKEYMMEVNAYYKELRDAQKSGDKNQLQKLKRKESRITTLQRDASSNRLKVTMVFFIPLMLIFWVLNAIYGNSIVAVMPAEFPFIGRNLSFTTWYFVCSLSSTTLLYKIFDLMPEMG